MPTLEEVKQAIIDKGSFDIIARGMWNRFVLEEATHFVWDDPREANGVPILARQAIGPQIVNHRLHMPFDRTIVNTKTAYFASNVAVIFDTTIPASVVEFYKKSNYANEVAGIYEEVASFAADSGTSFVLLSKDGVNIHATPIKPWNAMVKYDRFTNKPLFGVIYDEHGLFIYDDINVTMYSISVMNRKLSYDRVSVVPHGFGTVGRSGIPLVEFPNNPNRIGNAVMTTSLQDAYDVVLSDLSSEISQTRLAYLLMKGLGQDDTTIQEQMQKSGIILVDDVNGDAKFVSKDLKVDAVKLLQADLRRLIFEGAQSYDPASFSEGKTPPTAQEVNERLHPLEMDCQTTIQAWQKSLRYMDYLVQTFLMTWTAEGEYDLAGISRIFRRVAPRNTMGLLVEARQAGMVLSNGTMIELSGLQLDPVEEALRIDREGIIRKLDIESSMRPANGPQDGTGPRSELPGYDEEIEADPSEELAN
jgi:SPP1 family phage portal protein